MKFLFIIINCNSYNYNFTIWLLSTEAITQLCHAYICITNNSNICFIDKPRNIMALNIRFYSWLEIKFILTINYSLFLISKDSFRNKKTSQFIEEPSVRSMNSQVWGGFNFYEVKFTSRIGFHYINYQTTVSLYFKGQFC